MPTLTETVQEALRNTMRDLAPELARMHAALSTPKPQPAPDPEDGPKRIVHVVSWVYWSGGEQSSGGFDWYPQEAEAYRAFNADKRALAETGQPARLRLLRVFVPARLDGPAVTDWLAEDVDALEGGHPALRVALVNCPAPASAA